MVSCRGVGAPEALSWFTVSISAVSMIITTVGNLLVCIAVYKNPLKNLRTPFMFILVNLAVIDLVVGCITLPISVTTHTLEAKKLKKTYQALILHMSYFISCTASILNLSALCVDRYLAVSLPFRYRVLLTAKSCGIVAATIWTVAIATTMLYWVTGYIDFLFIYAHVAISIAFIIGGFTLQINRKLHSKLQDNQSKQPSASVDGNAPRPVRHQPVPKTLSKAQLSVNRTFTSILACFIACYLPAIIMMYILKFCPDCDCMFRHALRDLNFLLIVSNSAINPFVCTIRLKPFRQAIAAIFCRSQTGKGKDVTNVSFSNITMISYGHSRENLERVRSNGL